MAAKTKRLLEDSPHVAKALNYARGVVTGLIPAGRWVVLACKRQLDDLERQRTEAFPYYFDEAKAEAICVFAEAMPHVKGKWEKTKQLVVLEAWQCFLLTTLFGWLQVKDGLRRFREAYWEIPRKNGKSVLAAIIGLYMFGLDGESGAEVYSGATTESQAWEVFKPAKAMASKVDEFIDECDISVNAKTLSKTTDLSVFKPIIGKPGDGASPSCAIVDEFHEHDTPDLVETMQTGMGAREQPILLQITTAGTNLAGPCYDKHLECQNILNGSQPNETVFCVMYGIDVGVGEDDEGDDWADPKVLAKANPNMGVSVFADFLLAQQRAAMTNPAAQAKFKTKHLNMWGGARQPWMPAYLWDACADNALNIEEFYGSEAWFFLDLASKDDIAVFGALFRKILRVRDRNVAHFYTFAKYYIPEAQLHSDDNTNKASYKKWHSMGLLTVTEGEEIDFDVIGDDLLALKDKVQVKEIVYDPWRATQLAHQMQKKGAQCVELRQTVQNLSAPMKETLAAVKAQRFHHDGNLVTKWMVNNVTAKLDAKDNIFPRKERPQQKIDGAVGIIMGMARAIIGVDGGTIDDFLDNPVVVDQ